MAGGRLAQLSQDPPTGYFRDGYCRTGSEDPGNHSVGATVTQSFLDFTSSKGNNLKDAGVKDGMKWCLCAHRWQEAYSAFQNGSLEKDAVPKVHLHASDKAALDVVTYKDLKSFMAEPEAVGQNRQSSAHGTENSKSLASESQEIGSAQPTEAPGAGRNQSSKGEIAHMDGGSRG